MTELFENFIVLFGEAAPWLCLGLLISGIIQAFIPQEVMASQLGDSSFKTIIKASLIGAPLPLCSCGVIPTALALKKAGASRGSTASFLVSTPETGIDSISISYAMLGPFMAIVRPIAAIISAIFTGLAVEKFGQDINVKETTKPHCCAHDHASKTEPDFIDKVKLVMSYGFGQMIRDTAHWLLIGLVFAALVTTYVPTDFLAQWGDSIVTMLVLVLVSIPMYICATASTPIAAGLLLAGISPGAVLVFMLAGPATNIALIGVVKQQMGNHSAIAYLTGVVLSALLLGLLIDLIASDFNIPVMAGAHIHEDIVPIWLTTATSVILAGAILNAVFQTLKSKLN